MKYRKEIDGLRALAVIPVILFHAGFTYFSGGFVGVDVFFVISGYLITTIIVAEMEKGSFSLLNFYERRARRILPALFLVMICTLPFAWYWMSPEDLKSFSKSLIAVPIFVSNILFWKNSGYFETGSDTNPLIHTWSLAVEEQYYLLFPLLLMLTWKLGKVWIVGFLSVIAIISLSLAQWGSSTHSSFTFFLLPTRVFEILIGALISFYINSSNIIRMRNSVSESFSFVGLLMIVYAIFAFDKTTPIPGLLTLVPAVGTGLILAFSNTSNLVGKILGSKIFVSIGVISFSAYLWHQPILAFARLRFEYELTNTIILLLCLSSLILGYLSWKYVENPFRTRTLISTKKVLILSLTLGSIFICLGLFGYKSNGIISRFPSNSMLFVKPINFRWSDFIRNDLCHLQDPNLSQHDSSCMEEKRPLVALWGDSHASSLYPGLKQLQTTQSFGLIQLTEAGCGPILNLKRLIYRKNCNSVNAINLELLSKNKPDILILHGAWLHQHYPLTSFELKDKMNLTIQLIKTKLPGTEVIIIGPVPRWAFSPQRSSFNYWIDMENKNNSVPYMLKAEVLLETEAVLKEVSKRNNVRFISALDVLCINNKCLARLGETENDFLQIDRGHLSKKGSEYLINKIQDKIFIKTNNTIAPN